MQTKVCSPRIRTLLSITLQVLSACAGIEEQEVDDQPIVGGVDAQLTDEIEDFSVALANGFSFCSGTLIDDQFVLTTASCVNSLHPTTIAFGLATLTLENR